jgi:predicted Zn-dependent protease
MKHDKLHCIETSFDQVSEALFNELTDAESLNINISGEETAFLRMNNGRVRQTTNVEDGSLRLTYFQGNKTSEYNLPFTGHFETDLRHGMDGLNELRAQTPRLPVDPFVLLPKNEGSSSEIHLGHLLEPEDIAQALIPPAMGADMTGIYAGGLMYRGNANSKGQRHWFVTELGSIDYSLMAANEKTVKGGYATSQWDQARYEKGLHEACEKLKAMEEPVVRLKPGKYRSYLAPAAVAEVVGLLTHAFSESRYRQGRSPTAKMKEGKTLSPLLNLRENFKLGVTTRFNQLGEMADEQLDIIRHGKLANTLINSRTAKEYGIEGNAASNWEGLRSSEVLSGDLERDSILKQLGTGLYLSNLHYLNWSDVASARMTGMTRFACFWVENGKVIGPIENMRFDDSIFDFLGSHLEGITDFQDYEPEVGTYFNRNLGGTLVPGILTGSMTFTL